MHIGVWFSIIIIQNTPRRLDSLSLNNIPVELYALFKAHSWNWTFLQPAHHLHTTQTWKQNIIFLINIFQVHLEQRNSLITEEQQKQWYLTISLTNKTVCVYPAGGLLCIKDPIVNYFIVFIFNNNVQFRKYLICSTKFWQNTTVLGFFRWNILIWYRKSANWMFVH